MSARQSPVERDARGLAAAALKGARGRRTSGDGAWQVIEEAVRACERATAYAMQRDDIPAARRQARAARLLDEAQKRLNDRQARDNARVLAQAGIVPNARVVVVRAGYSASAPPVGTVMTLGDETATTYFLRGTDDDGRVWLVNFRDVEVVPEAPMPHDDEYDEDPAEPPYGDRILALGLWSDSEAFELAGVANAAASEGRDPGPAVQDRVRAWDDGEASA